MRSSSIRNQILVPLIGIQAVAVTAAMVVTATLAARRSEHEIIGRLNDVLSTLGHGNFPYTSGVLARMHGLSGAHFIVRGNEGKVTETSLPETADMPASVRAVVEGGHVESLANSPSVAVGGTQYFAARVRSPGGLRGSSLIVLYPETACASGGGKPRCLPCCLASRHSRRWSWSQA